MGLRDVITCVHAITPNRQLRLNAAQAVTARTMPARLSRSNEQGNTRRRRQIPLDNSWT